MTVIERCCWGALERVWPAILDTSLQSRIMMQNRLYQNGRKSLIRKGCTFVYEVIPV